MEENLHEYRKGYRKGRLSQESVAKDPMDQFHIWFQEAKNLGDFIEANAMTISTIGLDGFPKGRVVLLKKYSSTGFDFYTNYGSDKGKSISHNNKVSLLFFWSNLERQIIIKGTAEKTSEEEAIEYFHSRPKGSQLGAVVSQQSSEIESRKILEDNLKLLEEEYINKEIPKPENWGGYKVIPISFEFWQGRDNRLHDRIQYTLEKDKWKINRLAP